MCRDPYVARTVILVRNCKRCFSGWLVKRLKGGWRYPTKGGGCIVRHLHSVKAAGSTDSVTDAKKKKKKKKGKNQKCERGGWVGGDACLRGGLGGDLHGAVTATEQLRAVLRATVSYKRPFSYRWKNAFTRATSPEQPL